jgi:Transglutaminase-like superfamily
MRRSYLAEAFFTLVMVQLATYFVSTKRLLAWASRPPQHDYRFNKEEVGRVNWALETISVQRWLMTSALSRAFVAQTMLRRRGIASRLCLGVAHEGDGLAAHAWVEIGRDVVVGATGISRFTQLAAFGGERALAKNKRNT